MSKIVETDNIMGEEKRHHVVVALDKTTFSKSKSSPP